MTRLAPEVLIESVGRGWADPRDAAVLPCCPHPEFESHRCPNRFPRFPERVLSRHVQAGNVGKSWVASHATGQWARGAVDVLHEERVPLSEPAFRGGAGGQSALGSGGAFSTGIRCHRLSPARSDTFATHDDGARSDGCRRTWQPSIPPRRPYAARRCPGCGGSVREIRHQGQRAASGRGSEWPQLRGAGPHRGFRMEASPPSATASVYSSPSRSCFSPMYATAASRDSTECRPSLSIM